MKVSIIKGEFRLEPLKNAVSPKIEGIASALRGVELGVKLPSPLEKDLLYMLLETKPAAVESGVVSAAEGEKMEILLPSVVISQKTVSPAMSHALTKSSAEQHQQDVSSADKTPWLLPNNEAPMYYVGFKHMLNNSSDEVRESTSEYFEKWMEATTLDAEKSLPILVKSIMENRDNSKRFIEMIIEEGTLNLDPVQFQKYMTWPAAEWQEVKYLGVLNLKNTNSVNKVLDEGMLSRLKNSKFLANVNHEKLLQYWNFNLKTLDRLDQIGVSPKFDQDVVCSISESIEGNMTNFPDFGPEVFLNKLLNLSDEELDIIEKRKILELLDGVREWRLPNSIIKLMRLDDETYQTIVNRGYIGKSAAGHSAKVSEYFKHEDYSPYREAYVRIGENDNGIPVAQYATRMAKAITDEQHHKLETFWRQYLREDPSAINKFQRQISNDLKFRPLDANGSLLIRDTLIGRMDKIKSPEGFESLYKEFYSEKTPLNEIPPLCLFEKYEIKLV